MERASPPNHRDRPPAPAPARIFVGVRIDPDRRRGRGAETNRSGRFEPLDRACRRRRLGLARRPAAVQDRGAGGAGRARSSPRNESPDISFDRSINPYRGCEHGCAYCFARPTHAYMGLSPGLDFETKLFAKPNAAKLLEKELAKPGYESRTMAIGTNTDPYQPIERRYRIMREILEVLDATSHPVGIVTKSALVVRDIDILSRMAERGLVKVALSVTTLDRQAGAGDGAARGDAGAAARHAPAAVRGRHADDGDGGAGHPGAERSRRSSASSKRRRRPACSEAGYVLLRLPLEVRDVFKEFLEREYPDRAKHVMSVIRSMRGGKDYDAEWGKRMRGNGPYAWQIGRRFEMAARRLGLNREKRQTTCSSARSGDQLDLFAGAATDRPAIRADRERQRSDGSRSLGERANGGGSWPSASGCRGDRRASVAGHLDGSLICAISAGSADRAPRLRRDRRAPSRSGRSARPRLRPHQPKGYPVHRHVHGAPVGRDAAWRRSRPAAPASASSRRRSSSSARLSRSTATTSGSRGRLIFSASACTHSRRPGMAPPSRVAASASHGRPPTDRYERRAARRARQSSPASTRPGAGRWPGRWWSRRSSSTDGAIPTGSTIPSG